MAVRSGCHTTKRIAPLRLERRPLITLDVKSVFFFRIVDTFLVRASGRAVAGIKYSAPPSLTLGLGVKALKAVAGGEFSVDVKVLWCSTLYAPSA